MTSSARPRGRSTCDSGAYVRSAKACQLFFGSIVRTVPSGTDSVRVWTGAEFKDAFGQDFSAGSDAVAFMNGDAAANDVHVEGSQYVSGDIYANLNKARGADAAIRINYIVAVSG